MSFLFTLILFVIEHAPELISLVRAVIDLIRKLPKDQRDQARAEISDAVKTKDVGIVRDVLNHWHKRCEGVGCPMDTVGE